jgi:predicted nucleic acid-binding protein
MYPLAKQAVGRVLAQGDDIHLVPQVVTEYWRVATSPGSARGGYGWTAAQADTEIKRLEAIYPVFRDTPDVFDWWRTLVVGVEAQGASVYDARLAAAMLAHGWTHILTFNVDDFKRFALWGIVPVHPADV